MNLFRELLFRNWALKLISLFLAVTLWMQVASREVVQRRITVPVDLINLPSHLAISNEYAREVEITVETLRSLASDGDLGLAAVIDLKGAIPGTKVEPLQPSHVINRPAGMEIIRFGAPGVIRLEIEEKTPRLVPVEVVLTGEAPEDFEVVKTDSIPPEVRVVGPRSAVLQLEKVETVPIPIDGRSESFSLDANVFSEVETVALSDTQVTVFVRIDEKRQEVELLRIPVEILPEDPGARLLDQTVKVVGTVPISFQGDLEGFTAQISTTQLTPRREPYELDPDIIIPDEYQRYFFVSSKSTVRVRKRK